MTKLRNRLLTTLVLAAVLSSAIGVGIAAAKERATALPEPSQQTSSKVVPRSEPFSGEPDGVGGAGPRPNPNPSGTFPVDPTDPSFGELLVQFWILWLSNRT